MCSCFSAYNFILVIIPCISLFPTTCWVPTISVLNLAKTIAQKLKKIWDSSIMSSRRAITPGRLPIELWSLSTAFIRECLIHSFVRHYWCNKYYIFVTFVIMNPFSVWYACKLDSWIQILWAFSFKDFIDRIYKISIKIWLDWSNQPKSKPSKCLYFH
jgi:hypothetical protein